MSLIGLFHAKSVYSYICCTRERSGSELNQTDGQGCGGEAMILVLQGGVVTTSAG